MIKLHFYLYFLPIVTKTLRGVQTMSYKCLGYLRGDDVRARYLLHFLEDRSTRCGERNDSIYMKENKTTYSRGKCVLLLFLHPDGRFDGSLFFLHRLCVSFSSCHLNTVSHTVPSLPDGPWPSQPYLHLLAGPTSYHRGRLLAGNIHLYSLWSFIFHFFFPLQRWRLGKNPVRAALSQIFFMYAVNSCGIPFGPRRERLVN